VSIVSDRMSFWRQPRPHSLEGGVLVAEWVSAALLLSHVSKSQIHSDAVAQLKKLGTAVTDCCWETSRQVRIRVQVYHLDYSWHRRFGTRQSARNTGDPRRSVSCSHCGRMPPLGRNRPIPARLLCQPIWRAELDPENETAG
jgi:hypothetical protein